MQLQEERGTSLEGPQPLMEAGFKCWDLELMTESTQGQRWSTDPTRVTTQEEQTFHRGARGGKGREGATVQTGLHLLSSRGLTPNLGLGHWRFSRDGLALKALEGFGALMTVGLG